MQFKCDLYDIQKGPNVVAQIVAAVHDSKETRTIQKRQQFMISKRPVQLNRDVCNIQKRPHLMANTVTAVYISNETYAIIRDFYNIQKRPVMWLRLSQRFIIQKRPKQFERD